MIRIKNDSVLIGGLMRVPFHDMLLDVLSFVASYYPYSQKIYITSGHRPRSDKNKVVSPHETYPCRAVDVRSWNLPDPEALETAINARWIYDYNRPIKKVAWYHLNAGAAEKPEHEIDNLDFHLHLQVHPNTQLKQGV